MKKKTAKKPKPLSIQQQRFVNNILKGLDAKSAYIEAGYSARGKSAEQAASRMLSRNVKVQAAIKEVQDRANIAAEVTQQKIINEESRLAFYDPKELFDAKGKQLPIHKLPKNIRLALHGLEVIETLGQTKYKYKFHEKGKALERLEKIEGMFSPEKLEIDFDGKIEIIDSYAIPEDGKDSA